MTFDDFNLTSPYKKALADLGYAEPSTIQARAFSVIMAGKDLLGIAQTGTGKTIAYLLPSLRQLEYSKDHFPRILILVPTRELVVQVVREIEKLIPYTELKVVGIYGGANINLQIKALEQGSDVVVATPGRCIDMVANSSLKIKFIRKLILDEVDEMFQEGFRFQLEKIFEFLPQKRQNLLFSATCTEEVEKLLDDHFSKHERIEAAPVGTPLVNIAQSFYPVPNNQTKINLLKLLLKDRQAFDKVLIFVASKKIAEDLYDELSAEFPDETGVIHGNKAQNTRFNLVRLFRQGAIRLLVATDLVARGIDIQNVSHVINFDLPEDAESYIHRIGRTGRADAKGIAIALVSPKETKLKTAMEALMKKRITKTPLPEGLEISTVLRPEEIEKIPEKIIVVRQPKREATGAAFHKKSKKNSKVNVRVSRADEMMAKYGKKKTRGEKRKRKE